MRFPFLFIFLFALPLYGQQAPFIQVLGTAQDAGYPHAGCTKTCCERAWADGAMHEPVSCLGLVDPASGQSWLFDATPDLPAQMMALQELTGKNTVDGIFLTHAHIGHYTGLMYLGREVMGTHQIPVYAMPRMEAFLKTNGPWSQLVTLENIALRPITAGSKVEVTESIQVTPILVPHRDEYSETVGYLIKGASKTALFIPDIDKWERWDGSLVQLIREVDWAFIDATFFDGDELPGRDMSEIPHPFVIESMALLSRLPDDQKSRVYFIHMNHSNPMLDPQSDATKKVLESGFQIARKGMRFGM
ncbi:MAG: MBL fold metallo-hydrolase [Saprospiraceae bacterium]|nr:MBL fold metallo-hydrolase [Saprospiraceae bacterium]